MTRRRKTVFGIVVAMVLACAAGLVVYVRATAADRKVERLLRSLDAENGEDLLQKLGLSDRREVPRAPEAVLAELRAMGPPAILALAKALRTNETTVASVVAIKALGEFNDPRVVEPLARSLGHPWLSSIAVNSLANTVRKGNQLALERLMEIASAASSDQSRLAILALAGSGDERAREFISDRLSSTDRAVREDILTALATLSTRETLDLVSGALAADDEQIRIRAAYALAVMGDSRAITPLESALVRASGPCREAVIDALTSLRSRQEPAASRPTAPAEQP